MLVVVDGAALVTFVVIVGSDVAGAMPQEKRSAPSLASAMRK